MSLLCGALGVVAVVAFTRSPAGATSGHRLRLDTRTEASVTMSDDRFFPTTITIKAGQAVTWRNGSQLVHTVSGPGIDSGSIPPNGSWSHTFEEPGTYQYHCMPHQAMGMVGKVVVVK